MVKVFNRKNSENIQFKCFGIDINQDNINKKTYRFIKNHLVILILLKNQV